MADLRAMRASQVASTTIPPEIPPENEGDDDEGEESDGQPPLFGKEVMESASSPKEMQDTDHGAIAGDKKGDQKGLETADRRRKGVPGSVPENPT